MKRLFLSALSLLLMATGLQAQKQVPVYLDETKPVDQRIEDALSRMTLDEKIRIIHAQSKFSAAGIPRLGFPDLWTDDGPHGVRPDVLWDEWRQAGQTNDSCVAFPALTCLAASWNPDIARLYGESVGEEALYRGKSVLLGPGINILRTPLNGRNFEYMGEDPYLTARMVAPYIQGVQKNGVSACVKHFALNNDEEYRHQVNVVVSDRALHEIYLPGFRSAVQEGKAWSLMGSYNLYNNQHCCHNDVLLMQILKGDWQFDGVVISDWGGAHNTDEAVRYGLDLEMGTWTNGMSWGASNSYDRYHLAQAYKQGIVSGKYTTRELDDKVRRLLRLYYRTTMNRQRGTGFLCSDSHYEAALKIAQEGIVLLKNSPLATKKGEAAKPLLPLDPNSVKRILVVGENAIKMMTVGGGSSSLKAQKEILPLDGITARFSQSVVDYARGYVADTLRSYDGVTAKRKLYDPRTPDELIAEAVEKARQADVVIMVGGLHKSNYQDTEGHDRRDYTLPGGQDRLVEALVAANPRLVYVSISGNPFSTPWLQKVPAVVQAWYCGSESGEALATILSGDANPSGKLPFTWYARLEDCGAHALGTYPGTWREGKRIIDEEYKEDIFVGYRWTDRQKKQKPTFAFGHGLSYTTFQLGQATADKKEMGLGDNIAFTVSITNTGTRAGAEVVQLYVSDKKASVERPVKELKAFQKVYLQPGESRQVTLRIGTDALSFYDETTHQWVAEPGDFEALIGTASDRLTSKVKFTLK